MEGIFSVTRGIAPSGIIKSYTITVRKDASLHMHAHSGPQQPEGRRHSRIKSSSQSVRQGRSWQNHARGQSCAGACAPRFKVGLLDADIYGPNVPLMLGETGEPQLTPENMIVPAERYDQGDLRRYLNPGDSLWYGAVHAPRSHQTVPPQVAWGELDYLVVDLPPGTGDVVISLTQTVPLTGAVVVTTPLTSHCRMRARRLRCSTRFVSRSSHR